MWSIARRSLLHRPSRLVQERTYISRAHPRPGPQSAIDAAVDDLLSDIDQRRHRRERRYKTNQRTSGHPDETVELALNLNLDPRKPGQALRGSVELPHGTGKKLACLVFTDDVELQERARMMGAKQVGGEDLVEALAIGDVAVDELDRALATAGILPLVTKRIARLLGPRGLMPNVKTGTLWNTGEELLAALESQMAGREVQYRTEKEGIVHVAIGKGSFGKEKLLENIGAIMKEVMAVKPENYGKGKKSKATGKSAKYILSASLSSTQGPGIKVDLRTIDPASAFFLSSVEGDKKEEQPLAA